MMSTIRFLILSAGVLLTVANASSMNAGEATSGAAQSRRLAATKPVILFARDRLSVRIDDAALPIVLKLVAERTGARIVLLGGRDHTVGADFTEQPLEEGVRRLLRGRNLVFFYELQARTEKASHRLSEIRIFPLPGELWSQTTVFDSPQEISLSLRARIKTPIDDKQINPEIARLAKRLTEGKDGPARQQAATALAKISDPNVIGPLSDALMADAEPSVRATAAAALAKTWDEAAVAPLARALLEDTNSSVRETAAKALSATWSDNAVSPLIAAMLGDRDAMVREQAARGLAQTAGEEAVEALTQALAHDPRVFVREAAALALGGIGGSNALDALAKASLADSDEWVRETAAIAALHSPK